MADELISRKDAIEFFQMYYGSVQDAVMAVKMLNVLDTIDAVPVVRCKDCKYRPDESKEFNACPMWDDGDDGWGSHWHGDDNGFCNHGKRKDGDE